MDDGSTRSGGDDSTVAPPPAGSARPPSGRGSTAPDGLDDRTVSGPLQATAPARPGTTRPSQARPVPVPVPPSLSARYEVLRTLGMGGMAVVLLARDVRLGREVALKLIRGGGADLERRFQVEGRLLAAVEHENLVRLYDLGFADGTPYMIMELVRGQPLSARLAAGRLTALEAARMMIDISKGVEAIHGRGIVHRDLKPGNVFLDQDGRAKVADLGLACQVGPDAPEEPGVILGTPGYMAPEQARGRHVGPAGDVYALGVMLYEMLTGKRLFSGGGTPLGTVELQLSTVPRPPSTVNPAVPAALDELAMRALAEDPAGRPTASDMLAALRAFSDRAGGVRRTAGAPPPHPYKLLEPFAEADAPIYFGRDGEVAELAELVENRRVAVVSIFGPCGIGKSSLLRAGLARALDLTRFELATIVAGADPARAVRAAVAARVAGAADLAGPDPEADVAPELVAQALQDLASGSRRTLVLVVDQLEELFTLNERGSARAGRFFALVARLADTPGLPLRLVLSYRTEFRGEMHALEQRLGAAHHAAPLAEIAERGLVEAIAGPAQLPAYDFAYEPGLPERLAAEVLATTRARGEAALPVMQIVCRQLFDRMRAGRGGNVLTRALYEDALGGARGALERWVQDRLAGADYVGRAGMARQMLKALTIKEEGGERYARALAEEDVLAFPDRDRARATLERLVADHLVTREAADDGTRRVRLASEVICPLVDRWALVPDAAERAARVLDRAYRQWADQGRREEDLLGGGALAAVRGQLPALRSLSEDERRYLELAAARWRRRLAGGLAGGAATGLLIAALVWAAWFRPGRLEITSTPSGASIHIGGGMLGRTPLSRELAPGRYTLRATAPDHEPAALDVEVPAGGRAHYQPVLLYPRGYLAIAVSPREARWEVRRAGGPPGAPPFATGAGTRMVEVPAGRWRVSFALEGFVPVTLERAVKPNRVQEAVDVTLPSTRGWLEVTGGAAGAALAIARADGAVVAERTLPLKAAEPLPEGDYVIGAALEGHVSHRVRARVTRGATARAGLWMPSVRRLAGLPVPAPPAPARPPAVAGLELDLTRAAADDLDGDGAPDVVAAADGEVVARDARTARVRWRWRATAALDQAPVLADADGDGAPDVLLGLGDRVAALSGRDGRPIAELSIGQSASGPVRAADLDGDGAAEAVFVDPRAGVTAWSPRRRAVLWARPVLSSGFARPIADADADGHPDVLACDQAGGKDQRSRVAALSGATGDVLWSVVVPSAVDSADEPGDLDHDGAGDVALRLMGGEVVALSPRAVAPRWVAQLPGPAVAPALVADADGDGRPELLVQAGRELHVLDATTGATRSAAAIGGRAACAPAVLSRAGAPLIAAGAMNGRLRVLRLRAGRLDEVWSLCGGPPVDELRAFADLDRDGCPELLVRRGPPAGPMTTMLAIGDTGLPLWTAELRERPQPPAPPADVDGDGCPDVPVTPVDGGVAAISGRTGRALWWHARGHRASTPARADGRFGCVQGHVHAAGRWAHDAGAAVKAAPGSLAFTEHSARAIGEAGEALWTRPLEGAFVDAVAADVDGDRVDDAVVRTTAPDRTRALSGKTGEDLWSTPPRPLLRDPRGIAEPSASVRLHAIADVDGDRRPDLLESAWVRGDSAATRVLSGRTGRPVATFAGLAALGQGGVAWVDASTVVTRAIAADDRCTTFCAWDVRRR